MSSRSYRLFHVDAFTDRLFTGNPAGVVLDADGLTDAEMQTIAREMGGADTAFVLSAAGADHDVRLRFFSPKSEVPFVGHATVAAHVVRAQALRGDVKHVRQLSGTGVVEVDVHRHGTSVEVGVRPKAATPVRELEHAELESLLDALGAGSSALDTRCPIEIYSRRSTRLLLGLRSHSALERLKPDLGALARLTPHLGAEGYFVFTLDSSVAGCLTESRMFCPAIGIPEDPVSGNAHGMLGAYLVRHGLLKADGNIARFRGAQGAALDRPGLVNVEVDVADGKPGAVRIAGTAVIVFATTLTL
jgi:PhzF family phenazine biosynthesis protein